LPAGADGLSRRESRRTHWRTDKGGIWRLPIANVPRGVNVSKQSLLGLSLFLAWPVDLPPPWSSLGRGASQGRAQRSAAGREAAGGESPEQVHVLPPVRLVESEKTPATFTERMVP
jgi:hypothetical protein